MKKLKNILRQLHLILGLGSGLVVFIVSVTGCIYAFEEQIRSVIYKNTFYHVCNHEHKSLIELTDVLRRNYPDQKLKNIIIPEEKNANVLFVLKNRIIVYVNPETAEVSGTLNRETEFFEIVLKIHRSLLLGDTGKIITGTSALIFFFMIVSGIILWWPKNKRNLSKKIKLRLDSGKKRRNYDLHSVLGFYASWILIFSVITGLVFSFKWFEGAMYTLVGSKKEEKNYKSEYLNQKTANAGMIVSDLQLEYPLAEFTIVMPGDSMSAYRVTVTEKGGFLKKQHHFYFDQYTGKPIGQKLFAEQNLGEKLRTTNYNIHTGKVLGLSGQFIIFFAGLVAASLPVTGFLIWYRRNFGKLKGVDENA
ncbi:MAG: PepSY domain-containing protein [Bacteroidia bacterium]|nr:PepSY domain-containing protein [Bacteroidia bacterium]